MRAGVRRSPVRRAGGPIEVLTSARRGGSHAAPCLRLLRALRRRVGPRGAGVTLLLADDAQVRALNRRHRGIDRTTDVLSFPAGGDLEPGVSHLGDIAISVPRAQRQSRRARWPMRSEMALLVTHGFLHLVGYDHETDDGSMRRLEERLLRQVAGVGLDRRGVPWGHGSPHPAQGRRAARHARG